MQRLRPLSVKNITPYVDPFPKRADIAIVALQESLAQIEWMEKSFGRAHIAHKQGDEGDYIFPSIFVENGFDHADLLLNDNFKAYCFWLPTGAEEVVDDYIEESRNTFSRQIDLIVWGNLQQISTRQDDYLEELKDEVLETINKTRVLGGAPDAQILDVEIIRVEDKPSEVFREFTLSLAETKYLFYPFRGFRVAVTITFLSECLV